MLNFYKNALMGFLLLAILSAVIAYACLQRTFLHLPLLPKHSSALVWQLDTESDAVQGGGSTIKVHEAEFLLDYDVKVSAALDYPYASLTLTFVDDSDQPQLVDLNGYTSLSLRVKCSTANVLTMIMFTFDEQLTTPNNYLSYRAPSSYLSCDEQWKPLELDLTRLELPQWWFDMFRINLARNEYHLDKVARIQFGTTGQTPRERDIRIQISQLSLVGQDWRFMYLLSACLFLLWASALVVFFKRHSQTLATQLRNKLLRERPLVAYQQLSIRPHRDKTQDAIMGYFSTEYVDPELNLDAAVAATGVNRKKINDILKQELGFTFTGYLNKLRLTEAARLLALRDDANIAEIAYSVGYKNVSYFNKLFKEEYACTPKAYKPMLDSTSKIDI